MSKERRRGGPKTRRVINTGNGFLNAMGRVAENARKDQAAAKRDPNLSPAERAEKIAQADRKRTVAFNNSLSFLLQGSRKPLSTPSQERDLGEE